jgi:hypothetical protein
VDFVSACSAMPVYGLGLPTALRLRDDDTEVIATPRTGSGKVYDHVIKINSPGQFIQIGVRSSG